MAKSALVIVDVQNDFMPKGALGVPEGDQIVPLINRMVKLPFDAYIATQDFHPPGHASFASRWQKKPFESILIEGYEQRLWPDHCVQGTPGAEFASGLDITHFHHIAHKGIDPKVDSYSTFFDNEKHRSTGLEDYLREEGITDLYFAGLCTEYCVLYSVMDALDLGFTPHVVIDACRGVDLQPGDVKRAIQEMKAHGAEVVTTEEVIKRFS